MYMYYDEINHAQVGHSEMKNKEVIADLVIMVEERERGGENRVKGENISMEVIMAMRLRSTLQKLGILR